MKGDGSSFPNGLPDDLSFDVNNESSVLKIMKETIPENVKITDEAKDLVENCVVEFIAFVTKEANELCKKNDRRMITSEDLISAMSKLGLDEYAELLTNFQNEIHVNDVPIAAEGVVGVVPPSPPPPPHVAEQGAMPNEDGSGPMRRDSSGDGAV